MTILVYVKESLEPPVTVDEEFNQAIQALNHSMAKGNTFTVMDGEDGHEGFYIPNITRIKEVT